MNPEPRALRLRLRIAPRSHPSTSPANPELRALRLRTLQLRHSTSTLNRTLRLRRRTQSLDHAFDFAEITPQDHTKMAPIASIALRSQLRNGWVLMNLTEFDEFFLVGFCSYVYLLRNCIINLFGS